MQSAEGVRRPTAVLFFSIARAENNPENPAQNTTEANWNGRDIRPNRGREIDSFLDALVDIDLPPGTNQVNPAEQEPDIFLRTFLRTILQSVIRNGQAGGEVVLNTNSQPEKDYQAQLKQYVKTAFITIHNDETLASYLSEKGLAEEGREALTSFYPDIYNPLAHYAELLELEAQEIACPEKFDHDQLKESYSKRHGEIAEAKALLASLKTDEKPILIKKLMQGCSFAFENDVSEETKERINTLFLKIGALAGALHQGKLMSQETFALDTLQGGGQNLFQKACQEAVEELNEKVR